MERRRREIHESTTVPEVWLYSKDPQREARLCYLGHVLSENRHGLVVDVELTEVDGYAERDAAVPMLGRSITGPATVGTDRAYDTRDFVWDVRGLGITPHVTQNERGRRTAIDRRATRHPGCPEPAQAQAGLEGLRLDQHGRHRRQAPLPGSRPEQVVARPDRSGLQPHPPGQPPAGRRVAESPAQCLQRRHSARQIGLAEFYASFETARKPSRPPQTANQSSLKTSTSLLAGAASEPDDR